jgi:YidC/Oxa1 family membrane protein insertase
MEKRTVLAIAISLVVIIAYYFIISVVSPQKPASHIELAQGAQNEGASAAQAAEPADADASLSVASGEGAAIGDAASLAPRRVGEAASEERFFSINTNLIEAVFTNVGGNLVSFKLKEHRDGDAEVDMVLRGDAEPRAFALAFGGKEAQPEGSIFNVKRISDLALEFSAAYELRGKPFTLTKKYTFAPNEYMFELVIAIDGEGSVPDLVFPSKNGSLAYTLKFGPQIGPKFVALDERQDYRHYLVFAEGKVKTQKVNDSDDAYVDSAITWAAIAGKYFTLIAVPDKTRYGYAFSTMPREAGLSSASRLFIERPRLNASVQNDVFYFYLGPKTSEYLDIYDTNKSAFGNFTGYGLSSAANTSGFWAILNPLEWVLKWLLTLFFHLVPNYGVAIILVTLLVKLLLFPLTKKSSEGTLRMQTLSPKIKEIQAKYKDNPQKMNVEMGALYKKEGYNPLSGCLPMLIQIPIFFAMYNMFNNHFDLRGAIFIPGWIPDLSLPEYVLSFAPLKVPILGWSEIRALPFIYVGSQLLYGKVTQTPDQAGNSQMKIMLYVLPIVFFFVLYNVPSGLLVYWILSNVLTMVQQLIINRYVVKKRAGLKQYEEEQRKIIVPPKKRKRR